MTTPARFLLGAAALVAMLVAVDCRRDAASTSPTPTEPEAATAAVELTWGDDWNVGLARAAAENRPMVVVFTAEWCLWCRRLESATFTDRAVRTALAGAVLVDLDVDRSSGRERAGSLRVDGPPTTVVLSPAGVERGRILGYLPPAEYLARLEGLLPSS